MTTGRTTTGQGSDEGGVPGRNWVDVGTAARVTGVDTRVVRAWYRSGAVPVRRLEAGGGSRFLVPLGEVRRRAEALATGAPDEVADAERRAAEARKLQLEAEDRSAELAELVAVLRAQLGRASEEAGRLRARVRQLEAALRDHEHRAADGILLAEPDGAFDLTGARPDPRRGGGASNPWAFPFPSDKGDEEARRLLGLLEALPPVRFLPREDEAGNDRAGPLVAGGPEA